MWSSWRLVLTIALLCAGSAAGCATRSVPYRVATEYDVHDPQFVRSMGNLFGQPLVAGNAAVTLVNGEQIFPAMLAAIESAQQTITFETYMFFPGEITASFSKAIADRARAGVKVHVLIDFVGGGAFENQHMKAMRAAGADVRWYHPLHWWQVWSTMRVNYRTHRKLLVVDGRIGFIGGVGISDHWKGQAEHPGQWRDNHYRIEGPIVAQLQGAFVDNWIEVTGQVLHGSEYFPPLEPRGELAAQVLKSSTNGGDQSVQLMYLMSFAASQRRICLATPYFVPDRVTMEALMAATRRGVKVQVIVPADHRTDSPVAHQASRAKWGELIKAGVEIYIYQPTMYHTKLMVVDDLWVSIGSANLDNRSFRLNDEANLNVFDPDFAAEQVRIFEADLRQSRRVTYEGWARRSLVKKVLDGMSTLLDPLL